MLIIMNAGKSFYSINDLVNQDIDDLVNPQYPTMKNQATYFHNDNYVQKRIVYHKAFGREAFERMMNYLIYRSLESGKDMDFIMSLRLDLKSLINKIPDLYKEKEVYILDEGKIKKHYFTDDQLFDSKFYTLFLIENLNERLGHILDFSERDSEVKNMLTLKSAEKELLLKFASHL